MFRTAIAAGLMAASFLTGVALSADAAPQPTHPTRVCARSTFLADDFAHTHTGARTERRAVAACARLVHGF
jgi:hypothetical protein